MSKDTVRVLRILEYVGPRDAIEMTALHSNVPWEGQKTVGKMTIKSAIIDKFPEIVKEDNNE